MSGLQSKEVNRKPHTHLLVVALTGFQNKGNNLHLVKNDF